MHPIRKPRVFLSHSKKDVEFIRKLESDLRAAQCDPWIDEIELRSGQPWLDQIFGSGIPSCEVVLCYITANSLESAVFKQEMDARLLERLHNARVSLLLYVASPNLRSQLRLDLQRLQMPELHDGNYASAFPRVVAEIWRCYSESLVHSSIESERVRRLEAELRIKELESNASATVFTASENAEFATIWARLDQRVKVDVRVRPSQKIRNDLGEAVAEEGSSLGGQEREHEFLLDIGALFRVSILNQKFQPSWHAAQMRIQKDALLQLSLDDSSFAASFELSFDLDAELLRYGLVQRQYTPPNPNENPIFARVRSPFKLLFTSKFDRFGFWIEHNFGVYDPLGTVVKPL